MPVIVSNFNYYYNRGTFNEEQKDLKYSSLNGNTLPASKSSPDKSDAEDSARLFHEMMATSEINSSPKMPAVIKKIQNESEGSTKKGASKSTDKFQFHEYNFISKAKKRNSNSNIINIETKM